MASADINPGPSPFFSRPLSAVEEAWLSCLSDMGEAGRLAADSLYGTSRGRAILGQGAGGDRTLEIDRACEEAIRGVLARKAPALFTLVSEESGITTVEGAAWRVVVDPVDGSLNAKRGLTPFGASIAVAQGETLADVCLGHVLDYPRSQSFTAVRGGGLVASGMKFVTADTYRSDLVEIVLLEAGRPDRHHFHYHDLSAMGAVGRSRDLRVRQIGSLALSLCYVACGVADVLVAAVRARSVDIAAGLLILAEAGGGAASLTGEDLAGQSLDLRKRCPFVAWRAGLDHQQILCRARELAGSMIVPE